MSAPSKSGSDAATLTALFFSFLAAKSAAHARIFLFTSTIAHMSLFPLLFTSAGAYAMSAVTYV